MGVPQGKQPHALLVGGLRALTELFPRFVEQLVKSGAVAYDYRMVRFEMGGFDPLPQRDLGIPVYSASAAFGCARSRSSQANDRSAAVAQTAQRL